MLIRSREFRTPAARDEFGRCDDGVRGAGECTRVVAVDATACGSDVALDRSDGLAGRDDDERVPFAAIIGLCNPDWLLFCRSGLWGCDDSSHTPMPLGFDSSVMSSSITADGVRTGDSDGDATAPRGRRDGV